MRISKCGTEAEIVQALRRGVLGQELASHLAACRTCQEVAAVMEHVHNKVAGIEPGSGLKDEAERVWHVSRSLPASTHWASLRRRLLFARVLSLATPPVVTIILLRDRLFPSGLTTDTARIIGDMLDYLPLDATVAFAGVLIIVTGLAVLRLALSD